LPATLSTGDTAAVPQAAPAPVSRLLARAATFVAVAAAVVFAAVSGQGYASGSRLLLALPLIAAVAVALGVLALTRFSVFVMVMLTIRASLDLARLSGKAAGNVATNSAAVKGLDPTSLFAVLFLLAAVMWLAAQYRRQNGLPGSRLRLALVVFFLTGLVSVFGASNHQASALEALRILAVVVMFVVLEQMMVDRPTMNRLLAAIFASAAFPVAFTLLGVLTGTARSEAKGGFTRLTGTFAQANDFGRYLMVIIIFGVAVYPYVAPRLRRWLAVLLAGCVVCMMLTLTITAMIGTVVGLVIVGLVQSKRLLGGVVLACLCALLFVPQLLNRVTGATDISTIQSVGGNSNSSLGWRLSYWTDVLPLANANPVTGIGLNMTQYETDAAKQPHNDFLRAYVETGLLGFGAYVALIIAMLGLGRRAVQTSYAGTLDRGVAAGFWGVATAFALVSVAANVISNVALLWYVFAFGAAAAAVVRRQREQERALMPARVPAE